jgi:hypothetical protein
MSCFVPCLDNLVEICFTELDNLGLALPREDIDISFISLSEYTVDQVNQKMDGKSLSEMIQYIESFIGDEDFSSLLPKSYAKVEISNREGKPHFSIKMKEEWDYRLSGESNFVIRMKGLTHELGHIWTYLNTPFGKKYLHAKMESDKAESDLDAVVKIFHDMKNDYFAELPISRKSPVQQAAVATIRSEEALTQFLEITWAQIRAVAKASGSALRELDSGKLSEDYQKYISGITLLEDDFPLKELYRADLVQNLRASLDIIDILYLIHETGKKYFESLGRLDDVYSDVILVCEGSAEYIGYLATKKFKERNGIDNCYFAAEKFLDLTQEYAELEEMSSTDFLSTAEESRMDDIEIQLEKLENDFYEDRDRRPAYVYGFQFFHGLGDKAIEKMRSMENSDAIKNTLEKNLGSEANR